MLTNNGSGVLSWVSGGGACSTCFVNGGNSFGASANLGTNDANSLLLKTNNTTRLTIDSLGGVGIGLSSGSPTVRLDVLDTTNTNVAKFTGAGATQCTVVTGTGWSCSSDSRLKQNVNNIAKATDIIGALKPVTYQWNGGSSNQYGFIAQDVKTVLPDLVTTNTDGYLSLSKDQIIPFLVKALQETNTKVDGLGIVAVDGLKVDIESLKTSWAAELPEIKSRLVALEQGQVDLKAENVELKKQLKSLDDRLKKLEIPTN